MLMYIFLFLLFLLLTAGSRASLCISAAYRHTDRWKYKPWLQLFESAFNIFICFEQLSAFFTSQPWTVINSYIDLKHLDFMFLPCSLKSWVVNMVVQTGHGKVMFACWMWVKASKHWNLRVLQSACFHKPLKGPTFVHY